jgi:hypothetical protein
MSNELYVKSFDIDFILKMSENGKTENFLDIFNIIKNKKIKPNTKSFNQKDRLCCTCLSENYIKTYRAQGLIFQTKNSPKHVYPFDLSVFLKINDLIVEYSKIPNIAEYYSLGLIDGYKKFEFKDFKSMVEKVPSPIVALEKVNEIRVSSGFKKICGDVTKLLDYNEVVFEEEITIVPVAIFGTSNFSKKISKMFGLEHYESAEQFYQVKVIIPNLKK